ncbi:MAG TPA: hypothetical protein PLR85_19845 [Nitrospira sp.]|nr:hypothetical protein [Nitrospira sp.]
MTALQDVAAQESQEIDVSQGGNDSQERDWETEARDLGWRPEEDFKGDKSLWVDAQTFVKRGEEVMPILKSQLKTLKGELAEMRKEFRKANEFFSNSEQRGYERAMADIQAKAEAAAEVGDKAGVRAALEKAAKLNKPTEAPKAEQISREDLANWFADNPWYKSDHSKTAFADLIGEELAEKRGGNLTKDDFDEITRRVDERFAEKSRAKSAVEGSTPRTTKRGEKTLADLPPEARRQAEKWERDGICSTKDYLKNYQWDS